MLILLPPSEGKRPPRRGKPLDLATLAFPGLGEARAQVLEALVALCAQDPDKAAATLDVPRSQLDLVERNARLPTAPTARADQVYAGVLYDALDLPTLSPGAKRRAGRRLAITSSLFGLVRPADRIPAYRLSGDAVLPGVGGVAGLWREHLGPAVLAALGDGGSRDGRGGRGGQELLVDLRSSMYAAFWRPPADLADRVATVRVLHEVGGRRQVVSHFNKATKGRLVRALLEAGGDARSPAALAELLRDLGYVVEPGSPTRRGTPLDVVVTEV